MAHRKIKWGIMGAGNISRQFAADLAVSPNGEVVAVAAQSKERAEAFAKDFGIARAYDHYEALVQDSEVEIVYIGTLHPMHKDGMLLCLRNGKAVLCEKPFTMNAREAEEVIRTARENKLFLMEAMWTRYLPPVVQARQWIAEGRIGEVTALTANFGFRAGWDPNGRLWDKRLGGGALLDAGIYPVSFASMVFGRQPELIQSAAHIGETGVDEQFAAVFKYPGGKTAALNGAIRINLVNDAYIYGTEGRIHLPGFLFGRSASLHTSGAVTVEFKDDRKTAGYIFEAEEAMRCLREGRTESDIMPLDETLAIMRTMDAMRAQWGLTYPADTVQG
jgi:predicted dehydrogenase